MDDCAAGPFRDWVSISYVTLMLHSSVEKCATSLAAHLQKQKNYSMHYNAQTHWCIFLLPNTQSDDKA